ADGVPAAITGKDATIWGPEATAEASVRLGWLDCVRVSRPLVAEIEALRDELRAAGVDRVVLAGMGGSSLAPEVITATYGVCLAGPGVGGGYSALSAFGLVPAGLAGVPVGELLDQAAAVAPSLALDSDNPGLALGAALGGFGTGGHDKVVIANGGLSVRGF